MQVIEKTREFTNIEIYKMTMAPDTVSYKELEDGQIIDVDGFLKYKDTNGNGDEVELMSILSRDGNVYVSQSATLMRSLKDIHTIMDGEPYSIKKLSGTTKAGRPYVNCTLEY